MKKWEIIFSTILVPLDFLMIVLAALAAYFIRFGTRLVELRPIIYEIPFNDYLKIAVVVALGWISIFAISGLYTMRGTRRRAEEIVKVVMACSTGVMAIIVFIFLKREFFSSRFIILAAWLLSIIFIIVARLIVRYIQYLFLKKGKGIHRLVIIGNSKVGNRLAGLFYQNLGLGYRVTEKIASYNGSTLPKLKELWEKGLVDEIYQTDPNLAKEKILELKDFCDEHHLIFKYTADLFGTPSRYLVVETISGIPIAEIKRTPLDGWGKVFKRSFDLVISLVLIILTLPLMFLITLFIKLESKGPVLYKNERVSKDGHFKTLKFRSMYLEYCTGQEYSGRVALELEKELINTSSKRKGPVYKILNDPRRTKIGRFLEETSLDELPQLFNVLKGEMSLVGPRPHQPREVARYEKHHKRVLILKPGMTGLAQISGRSDLDFEDEVRLDSYYIENWSPWLDFYILLKTPFRLFKSRRWTS